MVMRRMWMPVETPTPVDVAVVRPPVDADAGEDAQQDPCIEDTGVEPVPRAARVQPLVRKQSRKKQHQALEACHHVRSGVTTPQDSLRGAG